MNKRSSLFLASGILLLFMSLYLFTRPAFFESWDFSETGQIGDTIGGITAPIINILGALLVYISFREQVKANQIQTNALKAEKEENKNRRFFNNCNLQYEAIKKHVNLLEFVVEPQVYRGSDDSIVKPEHIIYRGLNAINEFVLRLENKSRFSAQTYNTFGIYLNFIYVMKSMEDLINQIKSNVTVSEDQLFLIQNAKLYYEGILKHFAKRIINNYNEEINEIWKLSTLKKNIEKELNSEF